jgi:hypothetical protein
MIRSEYTFDNCPYKVRYGMIPSKQIENKLERPEEEIESRFEFYEKLEKSITDGFRNPISVTAKNGELFCKMHGGSRLYIAQKLNIDIPCLIADFNNIYSDFETINSFEELYSKFKDRFRFMKLRYLGVFIDSLKWSLDDRFTISP